MRILIGMMLGAVAYAAYQDPTLVEPIKQQAMDVLNWIGNFLVDSTGK